MPKEVGLFSLKRTLRRKRGVILKREVEGILLLKAY